jgi:putative SOS response-associated peptidase YedK
MCGRARCVFTREQVTRWACSLAADQTGTDQPTTVPAWHNADRYDPSNPQNHNLTPGSYMPVLTRSEDGRGAQVHSMRWGLVPSFTKTDEKPDFWRMFNARSERWGAAVSSLTVCYCRCRTQHLSWLEQAMEGGALCDAETYMTRTLLLCRQS